MPVRGRGRRYLSFWIAGERDYDEEEVVSAIREGVLSLFGTQGLSLIEPKLMAFDVVEQRGILRCDRAHLTEMRAALTFVTQIGDSASAIYGEKVSGTLRSLKKDYSPTSVSRRR